MKEKRKHLRIFIRGKVKVILYTAKKSIQLQGYFQDISPEGAGIYLPQTKITIPKQIKISFRLANGEKKSSFLGKFAWGKVDNNNNYLRIGIKNLTPLAVSSPSIH